jgi:hypothetical protein
VRCESAAECGVENESTVLCVVVNIMNHLSVLQTSTLGIP